VLISTIYEGVQALWENSSEVNEAIGDQLGGFQRLAKRAKREVFLGEVKSEWR
jgi:hypothetical protein